HASYCPLQFATCALDTPTLTKPSAPPFPYTTLFRSIRSTLKTSRRFSASRCRSRCRRKRYIQVSVRSTSPAGSFSTEAEPAGDRSEEHTSELQSRFDLVCRLLLEQKKSTTSSINNNM